MADLTFHFTRASGNVKTGAIPVSTSSRATCPSTCSLKNSGCYAENFPMSLHWGKVTRGERGVPYDEFLRQVRALPKGQLWRHNAAGDLVGSGNRINFSALKKLVAANKGRRMMAYTHYQPTAENAEALKHANTNGATINLSADSLDQADEYLALGIAPVVVIVPPGFTGSTPAGNKITRCPAQFMDITCATCGLCSKASRKAVVSFEAHGSRKKTVVMMLKAA